MVSFFLRIRCQLLFEKAMLRWREMDERKAMDVLSVQDECGWGSSKGSTSKEELQSDEKAS